MDPHVCSLSECDYAPDDRGSWSCRICGRHIEDDDSYPTEEEAEEDMRVYESCMSPGFKCIFKRIAGAPIHEAAVREIDGFFRGHATDSS